MHGSVSLETSSFIEEEGVAALKRYMSNSSWSFEHLESQLSELRQGRLHFTPARDASLTISPLPAEHIWFCREAYAELQESILLPPFRTPRLQTSFQACRHTSNS